MSPKNSKFIFFIFAASFCAAMISPTNAIAQKRDSLTAAEIELVRDAQAIDARTEIFIKAIDRRFLVLNNQTAPADGKKSKTDSGNWGEMPTGTRLQLFTDIKKILDQAISNIDDVAAHDRMDAKLFPKAVRKLAEAAQRFLPEFKSDLNKTTDEKEKGAILSSIEFCEQIIEASAKVPQEEKKDGKKKRDA